MSLPALHIGELTARIPIIQGGMGIGILLHLHMPLQYIIMMAISFGVSFAVTWVIWSPEEVKV